jgi:HlyD family secretion protein
MFIVVLVLLAVIGGAGGWYWHISSQPHIEYKTAKIRHGDLLATIGATGTLEPEEVVDVGAQVTGPITTFGKDADGSQMDYRSPVKKGMLLATVDPTTYKADSDTAAAQLDQAKANLMKANADVAQTEALLHQAEGNWTRAQKIGPSDALSQNDYDMYKANYESAKANVNVMQAEVEQAKTGITQAKATLDKANRNLQFCTIDSPVDGVIIDRRVNVGQTVVGSLTPASMFLIAQDLRKMQIWVAVNEADIGQIVPKQRVTFTCDAFPGKTFIGTVNKIRLNATMTQNVVTYTVEVNCENPDLQLYPYLTANVQFELQHDKDVLLVPNAALRWYPSDASEVVPDARAQWKPVDSEEREKPVVGDIPANDKKDKGAKGAKGAKSHPQQKPDRFGTVWVAEGEFVRPVKVKVGTSDGIDTEISAADLKDGPEVVVGEIVQTAQQGQERNPFLPQMKRR